MRKLIWTLVIVAIVAIFGGRAWYLYQHKETGDNVVKIGLLSTLSGEFAGMGEELNNGAILAAEEINQEPNNTKIKLQIEDGKAVPKEALSAFNKLLFSKIDAAIVAGDNQILPVAPRINEEKIPTIVTAVGSLGYLEQNKDKYMFHFSPSNYYCSYIVGQYAKDELSLNKVAILQMDSIFGKEGTKGFIDGYKQQPVIMEQFQANEEPRATVLKVLDTKPDGIYITGYGPSYISAIKRLKEYGFEGVILSEPAVSNLISGFNPREIASGIIFAEAKDLKSNPVFAKFNEKYTKRFGKSPTTVSAQGYEAVYMLSKAQKYNPQQIQVGLAQIQEFDTLLGKVHFLNDGNSTFDLAIKQMQPDGTAKVIKE